MQVIRTYQMQKNLLNLFLKVLFLRLYTVSMFYMELYLNFMYAFMQIKREVSPT